MGKRKERRLAALSNAGRRVKLDLFAEPSGDLGGSTVNNEDGKDIDSEQKNHLPKSPSSSGQQPQNPLLLLGQYSDDEEEEGSDRRINGDVRENSVPERNDESLVEKCEVMGVNADGADTIEQGEIAEDSISLDTSGNHEKTQGKANDASALEEGMNEQTPVPGSSETHIISDTVSVWKIVMHEESNSYYYWNTETGETSWEVPDVLRQATHFPGEEKNSVTEELESAVADRCLPSDANLNLSSVDGTIEGSEINMLPQSTELSKNGPQMNGRGGEGVHEALEDVKWVIDANQREVAGSYNSLNASLAEANPTRVGLETNIDDMTDATEDKSGFDFPSALVNQSECLLERLKSMKGSNYLQGHDWTSKYIVELEIRLSDIKSLSPYGSSLLPFWEHSQGHLKRLESAINGEIYQTAIAAQLDEVKSTNSSGKDQLEGRKADEYTSDGFEEGLLVSTSENSDLPIRVGVTVGQRDSCPSMQSTENILSLEKEKQVGGGDNIDKHVNGEVIAEELHSSQAGEDVDMVVDMEVEDASSAGHIIKSAISFATEFTLLDQPQQNSPAADALLAPDVAPLPPDEDWVPPPPPDNEEVPPPPPDEPPETSYSFPSYTHSGQHLSYSQQYVLPFQDSNYAYYGQPVSEVHGSNYYGISEVGQVALPHASLYYNPVPSTYTDTALAVANAIQPVAFHEIQSGSVPPVPVVSAAASSLLASSSTLVTYDAFTSEQIGPGPGSNSVGHSATETVGEKDNVYGENTSATVAATATISTNGDDVSLPSSSTVAAPVAVSSASASTKNQSKGLRGKKRTVAVAPSLRSNKKVSSLVDKWKAAKEELQEEEEEPENAYEILERKRQKEIEEWHTQQIASGEARDNANFQPLGGDWRERVKRRRAQQNREASQTPPESTTEGSQQPDLTQLSKDLPSGWQAYRDEATKQVYYGNVLTSETTWTRPIK